MYVVTYIPESWRTIKTSYGVFANEEDYLGCYEFFPDEKPVEGQEISLAEVLLTFGEHSSRKDVWWSPSAKLIVDEDLKVAFIEWGKKEK